MFFNTPCLNSRPCAGRNWFKRIVSRFLVRMSARFLLPSINQKLFLKCSMKWHYISTCFEHFSIFGPELWIHIVFKEDRWIKQQCHVRPPSWSDKAILTFSPPRLHDMYIDSLATTFQTRCISITFVNKLELLVIGCWLSHMKNPTVLRNGESPFLISTRTSSSYSSSPLHGNRDERSGRQGPVDSTYDWQFNQVLTLRRMYK